MTDNSNIEHNITLNIVLNIVQCSNEREINKIVDKNKNLLTLIYFCYTDDKIMNTAINNKNKKFLKNSLAKIEDNYIIYVDLKNYMYQEGKYSNEITPKMLPCIRYIFNNRIVGELIGARVTEIEENTKKLKKIIKDIDSELDKKETSEKDNKGEIKSEAKKETNEIRVEKTSGDSGDSINAIKINNLLIKKKMEKIQELKKEYMIKELERIRDDKLYEQNKKKNKQDREILELEVESE
jgi:hypothetical protein